jgi:hypothetical protein
MMESGCEFMKCEYAARDVDNNPVCKYEKDHCIEREMQQLHDVCQIEMKSVFDTAEARIADVQTALKEKSEMVTMLNQQIDRIHQVYKAQFEAVERELAQWRDLCTRQGMELKAVEVERDALREDKNRIEKIMQLGCQDSESVCLYWQTVKDWEKECDSLEIKNADLQAALATANQERDELKAEIADMKKHTWCAYCGHEILIDDDLATKISEHIMTCEKHPLHIALAALAAAQGDNGKLREVIETMILFIPDGWQMPLGWNQVVAQAQEALGGKP